MRKLLSLLFVSLTLSFAAQASADLAPHFGYVPPGYVAVPGPTGPGPVDLSGVWGFFGFQETGLGYAYVAGSTATFPYWDHFNPLGDNYETFGGAYVIHNFKYASDWKNSDGSAKTNMTAANVTNSANELIALGDVDQFAWLSFYSAPYGGPTAATPTGPVIITPSANGFWRVTFFVNTTSDLGAPTQPAPFVPPYSMFASDVTAFAPIVVEASVLIKYDVPSGDFLAVYGSATNYQVDGHDKNTPLNTLVQLALMEAAVTFQ